jgi:hypothetical protein
VLKAMRAGHERKAAREGAKRADEPPFSFSPSGFTVSSGFDLPWEEMMLRSASGIALGYMVMAFFVFATFSLAYMTLGAERSFQPGTYEVSGTWVVLSILLGVGAAIVGGYLCASVSRSLKAPMVLAGIVLVIGILGAAMMPPPEGATPQPRTGEVGNLEAMQNASTPPWIAWLNPFLGAAGVLLGARLRTRPVESGVA